AACAAIRERGWWLTNPPIRRDLIRVDPQLQYGRRPRTSRALEGGRERVRRFDAFRISGERMRECDEVRRRALGSRDPPRKPPFLMHANRAVHAVVHDEHDEAGPV